MNNISKIVVPLYCATFVPCALFASVTINPNNNGYTDVTASPETWVSTFGIQGYVGNSTNGELLVNNGSDVGTGNLGSIHVGYSTGSNGILTVDGPGSTVSTYYDLTIGNLGTGNLTISNGAVVTVGRNMDIGHQTSGIGNVVVTGSGSLLDVTSNPSYGVIDIGGNSGSTASGGILITDGGEVRARQVDINSFSSTIRISDGGKFSLLGDLSSSLSAFYGGPFYGSDLVQYDNNGTWEWLFTDAPSDLYSLSYDSVSGYTTLTIAGGSVPEPSSVFLALTTLAFFRRRR